MARLITSGLELHSITASVEFSSVNGSPQIDTPYARSGTYGLRINNTGTQENVTFDFSASNQTAIYYCRVYIKIVALPTGSTADIIRINSSSALLLSVRLYSSGKLKIQDIAHNTQVGSDSVLTLNLNSWYRIEVKVDTTTISSTAIELRVNQATVCSGTANIASGINRFSFGHSASDATLDIYYDDIAINDTSGSSQNTWPGPGKVIALKPNAAGDINTFATQTGGTAGSSNNYTRVNEVTPDDATTFNGSSTLNQEDLFNMGNSGIGANDIVNVVHIGGRFRNSTADATAAFKFEVEKTASGTILQSSAIVPNATTWKTNATADPWLHPITTYVDPGGAVWTQTTLDSMQAGYKLTTAPGTAGRRVDVSTVWVLIDYTPASVSTNFLGLML